MNIVLLANDDVSYSGLLSYPTLKNLSTDISAIFIQDGILNSNSTSIDLFEKVKEKSGFHYALSLVLETLSYKFALFIRNFFRLNKHENDCFLASNEKFGKIFGIPVFKIIGSIHDEIWIKKITELKPDLIVCVRYAEILKKPLLDIPSNGVINFHPSLLPKYKGLGPIFQAFLHDEKEIGFSFHYIDNNIDTGKIITQKKIKVEKNDSVSRVAIRAHVSGGIELLSIIQNLKNGNKQTMEYLESDGTYFSWPEKINVTKFFQSKKKYISLRDFFSLVSYNPKNFLF